jgi:hypothetical protein
MTSSPQSTYSPHMYSARNHTTLRSLASFCTGLAWFIAGLAGLGAFVSLFAMNDDFTIGLAKVMGFILSGGFSFVIWRIIAESILVLIDIETNTRETVSGLERCIQAIRQVSQTSSQLVKCPYCSESIMPDAKICRYCKSDISTTTANKNQQLGLGAYVANLPTTSDDETNRLLQGFQNPMAYIRESAINDTIHSKLNDPRIMTALEILATTDQNESIRGLARKAFDLLRQESQKNGSDET